MLDGVFGPLEDLFHRVVGQRLQPELLDLFELLTVRVGGIVLVVVVQPEQRKDLVNGLDMRFQRGLFSLPRRCR